MTNTDTNGSDLPASRQAAVEQGLAMYHETANERDALREQVRQMQSQLAAHKVALEAKDAQMADLESRAHTLTIVRDEAVGRRAELETVLASVMSVLRTFQIGNVPLVRPRGDDDEAVTIGGA
jgi:chromosome segregation ATPase